jgi:hypothetical protein
MSSDSDDDSSHLSKILNNDFVNSLNLKPEPPQLHMRNATRSVSEKKVSMSQDEDDVLIHVLRQHLGMELSATGRPRKNHGDTSETENRERRRRNQAKRDIIKALKRCFDVCAPSEEAFLDALRWDQATPIFPISHRLLASPQKSVPAVLEQNLKIFFQNIGKTAMKPAVGALMKDIDLASACAITGQSKEYVKAARAKSYEPEKSLLFTSNYKSGSIRQKLNPLEIKGTIEWAKSALGAKSGQKTADQFFRYQSKEEFYHGKYQTGSGIYFVSHNSI